MGNFNTFPFNTGDFNGPSQTLPFIPTPPAVTISSPLQPPPQQFTNYQTLLQANLAGVMVFRNGLLQTYGQDYTRTGSAITFVMAPRASDVMTAAIFKIGKQLGGISPQRYIAPQTLPLTGALDNVSKTYDILLGPTISGVCDGKNNLFTIGVVCGRLQVFRNGILQTVNVDYGAGSSAVVFLPVSIPQPGDIITFLGYPG